MTSQPPFDPHFAQDCIQGSAPWCSRACPFQLDVRAFISKLQRGSFLAAWELYQQAVIFPGLVSRLCTQPCAAACPLAENAPRLRRLEQAVIAGVGERLPAALNLPPKTTPVAVIGAGPSGLACALRLARKKYPVTVYEQSSRLGGVLYELLPEADFRPELERLCAAVGIRFCFGQPVSADDPLAAAAIYAALGPGQPLWPSRPGLFQGGLSQSGDQLSVNASRAALSAGVLNAIAAGSQAALSIEAWLKTRSLPQQLPAPGPCLLPRPQPVPPPQPPLGAVYTKEEAQAEAKRCPRCDCNACVQHCDMLRYTRKTPLQLANLIDCGFTDYALERHSNNQLLNSCADCGACVQNCPLHIDTGRQIQRAREQVFAKGKLPPAYHDFLLRDMEQALSPAASLFLPGEQMTERLFFPGCQMGASRPAYVENAYARLRQADPHTGLLLSCCGAPAVWAGDRDSRQALQERILSQWQQAGQPQLIFGCASCQKYFRRYLPQITGVSLYEALAAPAPRQPLPLLYLADPCSARELPGWRQGVSHCLQALGQPYALLYQQPQDIGCCGFGGDIHVAAPLLAEEMTKSRLQKQDGLYLTYCVNCRDLYAAQGKPVLHMLDLLAGEPEPGRPAPSLSQRRRNRLLLRQSLCRQYAPALAQPAPAPLPGGELRISAELLARLEASLLPEDQVRQLWAERTAAGSWLENADGCCSVHQQPGAVTCWLTYRLTGNGPQLLDFYFHRLAVEEKPYAAPPLAAGSWTCHSCGLPLAETTVRFSYLGHQMNHPVLSCPGCGQVYLPRSLVEGRMRQVEAEMEEK